MKILVTGATGRIGSKLVKELLNRGYQVRAFVFEGDLRIHHNLEMFKGDIANKEDVRKAIGGCDIIYHLAAIVDYLAPKSLVWKVNVEGTRNIFEFSKEKKVIFMSSTSVLGNKLKIMPADESTPYNPSNYYGYTKMEAEKIAKENNAIIIRSPSAYGPEFKEGFFKILKAIENGKMKIIGNGKNKLQYTYVDDLIQALILAMGGEPGEIYNIAGEDVKTQEELYQIAAKNLGVQPPIKHMSILFLSIVARINAIIYRINKKRPSILPEYIEKLTDTRVFDISKAKRELNYNPQFSFERGITEVVKAYKATRQQ